jgi:sodium pump decarboxylase gamma subunit
MSGTLETGINVTICGVAIVFGMLVLLVVLFSIFGIVMSRISTPKKSKKSDSAVASEIAAAPAVKSAPAQPAVEADGDDELIAVISAAVFAMYEGSGVKPVIRSVRASSGAGRSQWAQAGICNNIRSF